MIRPTGKTKPALDDLDLPAATLPIFEAFPLDAGTTRALDAGLVPTSNDTVLESAFFNLLFWFLWIGAWIGKTGGKKIGLLLSNKLSGILETA